VGRAQIVTLLLGDAMREGRLPRVPIHIDSPMAVDATRIYARHVGDENLDPDILVGGGSRLFPEGLHFHRSVEESKRLNALPGPRVIISASGMLSGGRVVHHLHHLLGDERNLVVLVGYQAAGTRGRALLEGHRTIRMHGEDVPVRARLLSMTGLSAHADADELVRWVRAGGAAPPNVFVTHGEPAASQALAARLERELGVTAHLPRLHETYDLATMSRT
jgi:metallo-beta-lactamase family protein